jgi:sugar-specific transcriptional regulator TrmB
MQNQLQELGFSKNESSIYLFLLKNGSTTSGKIIKGTGIANSRVYETLNGLIAKGMVTYTVQKDGKHFCASDPKQITVEEEERLKRAKAMVPSLIALQGKGEEPVTTAVYEGFAGFKNAFTKIIEDCPKDGTISILGFSKQTYAEQSLRTFMSNMNRKSEEKRQKLKILLDESSRETQGKDRSREKYTETRYLPEGFISPAAIDVFEDYAYIFLWEEKPYVFMIKNKNIAKSFKAYFDMLWKMAKK